MKSHNGDLVKRFGKYSIIKCKTCKFIHVNPIPTNKELSSLYTNDYYEKIKPDYIHVLYDGKIVKSGDYNLANFLEEKGYDWAKN